MRTIRGHLVKVAQDRNCRWSGWEVSGTTSDSPYPGKQGQQSCRDKQDRYAQTRSWFEHLGDANVRAVIVKRVVARAGA